MKPMRLAALAVVFAAFASAQAPQADPGKDKGKAPVAPTPPVSTAPTGAFPSEIAGKGPEHYAREARENTDPSIREASLRVLPAFGPAGRKVAASAILQGLTKDADLGVKLAAINAVQNLGFDDEKDIDSATKAMVGYLAHPQWQVRYEAIIGLGAAGQRVRKIALEKIKPMADVSFPSWQVRRASVAAIGKMAYDEDKDMPDSRAIDTLLGSVRDPSHIVRKEAMQAILLLGKPSKLQDLASIQGAMRERMTNDKDPMVGVWSRVVLIRMEAPTVKTDFAPLVSLVKLFRDPNPAVRYESYYAFGTLGKLVGTRQADLSSAIDSETEEAGLGCAIWALGQLARYAEPAMGQLDNLARSHKSEYIRKAALDAIAAVNKAKTEDPPIEKKKK